MTSYHIRTKCLKHFTYNAVWYNEIFDAEQVIREILVLPLNCSSFIDKEENNRIALAALIKIFRYYILVTFQNYLRMLFSCILSACTNLTCDMYNEHVPCDVYNLHYIYNRT